MMYSEQFDGNTHRLTGIRRQNCEGGISERLDNIIVTTAPLLWGTETEYLQQTARQRKGAGKDMIMSTYPTWCVRLGFLTAFSFSGPNILNVCYGISFGSTSCFASLYQNANLILQTGANCFLGWSRYHWYPLHIWIRPILLRIGTTYR